MKILYNLFLLFFINGFLVYAQQNEFVPDLSEVKNPEKWSFYNRNLSTENNGVYLNAKEGDGLLWLNNYSFSDGKIEVDIKGKNERGKSFVGLAFHGLNDSTFDAIYFRPFNFKDPERNNHSVQYISHPEFTWYKLREENPGEFENSVTPVPEPENWFHATIIIDYLK